MAVARIGLGVPFERRITALSPVTLAAWHSLAWLVIANLVGVWLAFLLLVPGANQWIGEWSYGRWLPVHMNLHLYGWISFPLVGWLIRVYGADTGSMARWGRCAIWMWSIGLGLGSFSWLNGHSSGKLFLDWTGYVRVFFPLTLLFLWGVLVASFTHKVRRGTPWTKAGAFSRALGILPLSVIPFAIYAAASPHFYPSVNSHSGGPTAANEAMSVLLTVLILLLLPYGLGERQRHGGARTYLAWSVLGIEFLFSLLIHWTDESRHSPSQFLGLASLLIWGPLIPWHYMSFRWDGYARPWRNAVFFWWVLLIPMGWALFQVPVLERLKFTDGLVAHSLLAMAGFVTSLLFLLLSNLLKEDSVALSSRWAFYVWQGATLIYVLLMLFAGWVEGADPTFTIVPGTARNLIYTLRLLLGTAMTIASAGWFFWLTRRLWTASATENAKRSAPEKLPLAQIQLRAGLAPS